MVVIKSLGSDEEMPQDSSEEEVPQESSDEEEQESLDDEDQESSNENIHASTDEETQENSSGGEADDDADDVTNAGWVDQINKIINSNKPKGKKTIVLSKAKKLNEVKPKPKPAGFEVETKDGEVKAETLDSDSDEESSKPPPKRRKREFPSVRVKPDILQKDRERTLSKIATKGVVQLFNSVKVQQKDLDKKLKEAGPLEVRRDKVLKNLDKQAFMNTLLEEKSQRVENVDKTVKIPEKIANNPKWDVLREDFMLDAKMKDWDKQLEEEDEPLEELECD